MMGGGAATEIFATTQWSVVGNLGRNHIVDQLVQLRAAAGLILAAAASPAGDTVLCSGAKQEGDQADARTYKFPPPSPAPSRPSRALCWQVRKLEGASKTVSVVNPYTGPIKSLADLPEPPETVNLCVNPVIGLKLMQQLMAVDLGENPTHSPPRAAARHSTLGAGPDEREQAGARGGRSPEPADAHWLLSLFRYHTSRVSRCNAQRVYPARGWQPGVDRVLQRERIEVAVARLPFCCTPLYL